MDSSTTVLLLVASVIGIVALLITWAVLVRRRSEGADERQIAPESLEAVSDARYEPGEMPASLVSEQIEEMVKERLSGHADLAGVKLDFSTGQGEALVVWINDTSYTDIDQIPDDRIREAISEAVDAFNQ